MDRVLRRERGSVLIMAVIAMLILGVLSVSFQLLASVEAKIGVNYKQQAQAEGLAEAGLEVGRDAVRTAATTPGGFTPFLGGPLLASGVPLGAGQYWARIDNDCNPLVPTAIEEGMPSNPGTCVSTGPDNNEIAVVTAWAETSSGVGRARVRAVVGVDNPWKHVCSAPTADNNGFCNDPSNANGNPKVTPADPNDPNGPAAYTDLPRPILGCSTIDPTMHGGPGNELLCPPGTVYTWNPATSTYRQMLPFGALGGAPAPGARLVLMGEDPALNPAAKYCYEDPVAGKYWGYFDCALQTPCDGSAAVDNGLGGMGGPGSHPCRTAEGIRPACVRPGDTRVGLFGALYKVSGPAPGILTGCPGPTPDATGMVFNWSPGPGAAPPRGGPIGQQQNPVVDGDVGRCNPGPESGPTRDCVAPNQVNGRNVYILRQGGGTGKVEFKDTGGGYTHFYGTIVVEGDGSAVLGCAGVMTDNDVALGNQSVLTTGERNLTTQALTGRDAFVYGYPLTIIAFDPQQATGAPPLPTINPYAPQTLCADMGSANTFVNGMMYSGGSIQFNPIQTNGSVLAFEIQTQGGALSGLAYNSTYGLNTPPPGFPVGPGNQVIIIRKSFIVCTSYNDETGGATPCN